ncbi:MAG: hypothetical protein K6B71_02890 [Alphaproteobacteria bacterium]|nr:hypothetical protein [Alphaproteobacteria bacterium]
MFPHTSVYAAGGCAQIAYGTQTKNTNQWGNVYVINIDGGALVDPTYFDGEGGKCNNQNHTNYCRISVAGTNSNYAGPHYYANRCGSDCAHYERTKCSGNTGQYTPVPNTARYCAPGSSGNRFAFGPIIHDGSTTLDWHGTGGGTVNVFGKNFDKSMLDQTATASFDNNDGNTYFKPYAWKISNCKFMDQSDVPFRQGNAHCNSGTITWAARGNNSGTSSNNTKECSGNAALGFYIEYYKEDAVFTCDVCDLGWTGRGSNCDSCDVAGHWNCSNGTPQCYRGYELSSYNTCDQADHFDCTGSNWNNCSCRSGFSNNGTDGRNCGPTCKENFTLSDDGQYCNCLPPYTLNVGDPDIPEDDTCGFDAGPYEDSTGWFTLISDDPNVCSSQQ